jgi:hypothetical protein
LVIDDKLDRQVRAVIGKVSKPAIRLILPIAKQNKFKELTDKATEIIKELI